MTTAIRLVALVACLKLAATAARAEPPTAPLPHPTLADVASEYKRLGLPVLPPGAELVRVRPLLDDGHGVVDTYDIAYRVASPRPRGRDRLFSVSGFAAGFHELTFVEPNEVEATSPTVDALRAGRDWDGIGFLTHAVQCRECGWDDLAALFYQRALQQMWSWERPQSVPAELCDGAWRYWERVLFERGTDRRAVLRRLERIAVEAPKYRNDPLLQQLRLTLAPSRAKPGTPAALIDEMVDYRWDDTGRQPLYRAQQASLWKLAALGFDAVPALIAHVGDDRLAGGDSYARNVDRVTVGHLCSWLLIDLSDGAVRPPHRGERVEPETAQKWFEQAKKGGEEKWLLDHVVPADDKAQGREKGRGWRGISLALGAKYPGRLPTAYRAALKKPADVYWSHDYADYAGVLAGSKLPREQRIALLEEGAASGYTLHRLYALAALGRVDPVLLRKHLLVELARMRFRALLGWPVEFHPWLLVRLTDAADDPACWEAMFAVCRGAGTYDRFRVLHEPCFGPEPLASGTHRLEWVRFMTQFLDDAEFITYATGTSTAVRDYAAARLEGVLGLREVHPLEALTEALPEHLRTRGPFGLLCWREFVRQAAWRELVPRK